MMSGYGGNMDANKYSCPNCGSGNTASIPLVYKRGHATGNATHREVVSYNVQTTTTTHSQGHKETEETGRTPVYGNVTRPTYTETDLAKEVAPPTPPDEPQLIQSGYDFVALGCGSIGCLFPFLMLVAYVILKYFIKKSVVKYQFTRGLCPSFVTRSKAFIKFDSIGFTAAILCKIRSSFVQRWNI